MAFSHVLRVVYVFLALYVSLLAILRLDLSAVVPVGPLEASKLVSQTHLQGFAYDILTGNYIHSSCP